MKKFHRSIQGVDKIQAAIILFFAGLLLGIICANLFRSYFSTDLLVIDRAYYKIMENTSLNHSELLKYTVFSNARKFVIFWIFCITILGIPYIAITIGYKGFETGFLVSAFTILYGAKGVLLFFSYLLPQGIIYLPVMVICLNKGYELAQKIYTRSKNGQGVRKRILFDYASILIILFLLLVIGSIVETYFGMILIQKTLKICV